MSLFDKIVRAVTDRIHAVNSERPTQIVVDGTCATHREIGTGVILWTVDLRNVIAVAAYVQTAGAIDYVTVRLSFPDQTLEVDDDTGNFSTFMRSLEEIVDAPLLEEALALARPAYAGANAVLWEKP